MNPIEIVPALDHVKEVQELLSVIIQHLRLENESAAKDAIEKVAAPLGALVTELSHLVPKLIHHPFQLPVTTGQYNPDYDTNKLEEYPSDPPIPFTISFEDSIRVIMGRHPPFKNHCHDVADVLIERQLSGQWLIFFHPDGGDPITYTYLKDSGEVSVETDHQLAHEVLLQKDLRWDKPFEVQKVLVAGGA